MSKRARIGWLIWWTAVFITNWTAVGLDAARGDTLLAVLNAGVMVMAVSFMVRHGEAL